MPLIQLTNLYIVTPGQGKKSFHQSIAPSILSRYYQEIAPGTAMDKSEIVRMNQTVTVPAVSFSGVIKMKETTILNQALRRTIYTLLELDR
jgi:ATP-dependent Lon protease